MKIKCTGTDRNGFYRFSIKLSKKDTGKYWCVMSNRHHCEIIKDIRRHSEKIYTDFNTTEIELKIQKAIEIYKKQKPVLIK